MSVEQESEWIFLSELSMRGTGRTVRAATALHDWAVENPDKRAAYVCMYEAQAQDAERNFFDDTSNVTCIGSARTQSLRGWRLDRLDFDHYALSESYGKAIARMKDLEYQRDKYKADSDRLIIELANTLEDLVYARRSSEEWQSNEQDQAREVARLTVIIEGALATFGYNDRSGWYCNVEPEDVVEILRSHNTTKGGQE